MRCCARQAIEGRRDDSSVAAVQPAAFIDIRRNFYLVPIVSHEDVLVGNHPARLLQVASVPLHSSAARALSRGHRVRHRYDALDAAVHRTHAGYHARHLQADRSGRVSPTGFPTDSSLFATALRLFPALGYVRGIRELDGSGQRSWPGARRSGGNRLERGIRRRPLRGHHASGRLHRLDGPFARYVILITDAGPRLADDPLSSTGLDTAALREARGAKISPWVIHLQDACRRGKGRPQGRRAAIPQAHRTSMASARSTIQSRPVMWRVSARL